MKKIILTFIFIAVSSLNIASHASNNHDGATKQQKIHAIAEKFGKKEFVNTLRLALFYDPSLQSNNDDIIINNSYSAALSIVQNLGNEYLVSWSLGGKAGTVFVKKTNNNQKIYYGETLDVGYYVVVGLRKYITANGFNATAPVIKEIDIDQKTLNQLNNLIGK